jgi:plasmid maintenance system antidote protein VapI
MARYGAFMNIQALMRERGLKQWWIAERLDMDETLLSRMFTGRRHFPDEKVGPLAKLLGVRKQDVEAALGEARLANGKRA